MKSGQLTRKVPHFPRPAETWHEVEWAVTELTVKEHPYKTLVIDTLNGAERLLHEQTCSTKYEGDWARRASWASSVATGPQSRTT